MRFPEYRKREDSNNKKSMFLANVKIESKGLNVVLEIIYFV